MPSTMNIQNPSKFDEINTIQNYEKEILYLESFLKFLSEDNKNGTTENNSNSINTDMNYESENTIPATLIQLMILLSVLLAVYLIYKCNKIMMACRDFLPSHSLLPFYLTDTTNDSDIINEGIGFKEMICYSCYKRKAKMRYKNRRLRNHRFNRNIKAKQQHAVSRVSSLYCKRTTSSLKNSSQFRISNNTLSESSKVKQKSLQRNFNSVRFA